MCNLFVEGIHQREEVVVLKLLLSAYWSLVVNKIVQAQSIVKVKIIALKIVNGKLERGGVAE